MRLRGLIVLSVLCATVPWPFALRAADLRGQLTVAGHGPEQEVLQSLARAFEKAHPGTAVEIKWSRYLKTLELLRKGEADIAVTGHEEPEFTPTQIAWDGIAIIVNAANPVREVTLQQVADLFTGKIKTWAELQGSDKGVELIRRPADRNLNAGLEQSLGIVGKLANRGKEIRSDQDASREVGGGFNAVSYLSLGFAQHSITFGTPIAILTVDKEEPAEHTVRDGRYKIRRPVLLLSRKESNPLVEAFLAFCLSPEGQRLVDEQYIPLKR